MDYQKAFTVIFEDKQWVSKVLIGGLLYLASFLILPLFIVLGYLIEYTQMVSRGDMSLPEWTNMGDKFVKGIKLFIVIMVYALPALVIIGLTIIVPIVIAALGSGGDSAMQAMAPIALIIMMLGYALYFIYILFLFFLLPAITIRFAQTENIGECLKFKEIFNVAKTHLADILMIVLFLFVANIVSQIGIIACFVGILFTSFYAMLAVHNLYGQFAAKLNAEGNLGQ